MVVGGGVIWPGRLHYHTNTSDSESLMKQCLVRHGAVYVIKLMPASDIELLQFNDQFV